VRDLLDLARMNRHEFSVDREAVELGELARAAVARHEASAREFGVTLAAEGDEAWVEGDHDACSRSHRTSSRTRSARHRRAHGHGALGRPPAERLGHGPGLELADLPHAFDRFFLYDKYGRERPVGSGLGLAIVKQLTERWAARSRSNRPGGGRDLRRDAPPAVPASVPVA